MKYHIIIGLMLAILIIPNVSALVFVDSCINSTHLLKESVPEIASVPIVINQTVFCAIGCDAHARACSVVYNANTGTPIELYILLEIIAFAFMALTLGLARIEDESSARGASPFLPVMAFILFIILAISGGTINVGGQTITSQLMITVNYMFALIALILSFVAGFGTMKNVKPPQ